MKISSFIVRLNIIIGFLFVSFFNVIVLNGNEINILPNGNWRMLYGKFTEKKEFVFEKTVDLQLTWIQDLAKDKIGFEDYVLCGFLEDPKTIQTFYEPKKEFYYLRNRKLGCLIKKHPYILKEREYKQAILLPSDVNKSEQRSNVLITTVGDRVSEEKVGLLKKYKHYALNESKEKEFKKYYKLYDTERLNKNDRGTSCNKKLKVIVDGKNGNVVKLVNIVTGEYTTIQEYKENDMVSSIDVSCDGKYVISTSYDDTSVRVFDVSGFKKVRLVMVIPQSTCTINPRFAMFINDRNHDISVYTWCNEFNIYKE